MPVQAQTRVNRSTGNGVTTVFPYSFRVLSKNHIRVTVDGVVKTVDTDYTVSGVGAANGGNVTFTSAPANATAVVLSGSAPYSRSTDYVRNGSFQEETVDADFDLAVILIQQLDERAGRAIAIPISDATGTTVELPVAASRANKALVFDADGDVTVSADDYEDQLTNVTAQAAAASASAAAASSSASASSDSAAAASASAAATVATSAATAAAASAAAFAASAASATTAADSATTATNQAAAAAASALSAASVVSQDLSAIDRTVFAATIVDTFLYDTSKDSDGGAWRHRCGHTSWEAETLSGNWLGSAANETAARAISGATTGSYYYDTTAAGFYTLNAGSGKTATYRGNVRKFPAQVLITVEVSRVVLWDLTQAAAPMWMVFTTTTAAAVAMVNGVLVIARNGGSQSLLGYYFVRDRIRRWFNDPAFSGWFGEGIATRNGTLSGGNNTPTELIASAVQNDVAMTVLPNAPVDVATGLPVPTIAVATNGGISVIKDDGTVSSQASAGGWLAKKISISRYDNTIYSHGGDSAYGGLQVMSVPPYTSIATLGSGTTTAYPQIGALNSGYGAVSTWPYLLGGNHDNSIITGRGIPSTKGLTLLRENPSSRDKGMVAYITKDYNSGWQVGAVKGAWLADTTAETITGTELVTNGDFPTDTTGWTTNDTGALSIDTARLKITNQTTQAYAAQGFTTVIGKTYVLTVTGTSGTAFPWVGIGTAAYTSNILALTSSVGATAYTFTATATTTYVNLSTGAATIGIDSYFDNISCRLADVDRSVKAKGLQIFGSLTKAAVASGAALMGYSGFSAANYAEQPYNSDLDFGTGDFCIMGWLTEAPNSAIEYLFNRDSATPGKAIRLWVSVAGYLVFELYDGTTTRTATGAVAVDTSTRLFWLATYSAGTLTIYVNGVSYATSTGAALLTLTNASAVTRVGLDVAGSYPATNANLALVRASATAPTAEQIKHIYETEKALFEANASCVLAGTSNAVTALAYDEETDLLHVGTSYGRSAFKGLTRVSSEATPVGAITALAASSGVVVQGGASGADVYVPAYTLREELLRDAEQMAKFGQNLIAHDFTATASQTTFTLPVGWEIVAVYQQGAIKRETTSWTRSFDGFKWSAVLGTGATVSDWISILAKRV